MAEPGTAPTVPSPRRWAARVPLALVWLAAAAPVGLWLVQRSDPELAVRMAQVAGTWLGRGLVALAVGAAVAGMLHPPLPAGVRLLLHRARLSVATDRGPLLRAIAELRHFESAAKHLEAGRLALQLGDLTTAAPHLQRAVELDPDLAGAHFQFGRLLFRIGQLPSAQAAFARAEQLDPGHAFGDALLHAGRCLDLAGQHAQAVAVLQQHAARHGGGRRSSYWLGEALLAAGDGEAAGRAFAAAAAPPTQRLTAEENWFRALARVRQRRRGGQP